MKTDAKADVWRGANYLGFLLLLLMVGVWFVVVSKAGVWIVTARPAAGVWPRTFNAWHDFPISRHLLLVQFDSNDFARGAPYTSYSYPFILLNFVFLKLIATIGVPYEVGQHFLAYFYVACLTGLFLVVTRGEVRQILTTRNLFLWGLLFLVIGIVVTDPSPWLCTLRYNADNFHLLAGASFCYLSVFAFHDKRAERPLLIVGLFLALWSPVYLPPWILCSIFLHGSLTLTRRWIFQTLGVSALAVSNLLLPSYVCRWAGLTPSGSPFLYRSGLDGSTQYFISIYQAVFAPSEPRHWPTSFYVIFTALAAVAVSRLLKNSNKYPLRQAAFLLIPYATMAIVFPQLTSIHPYTMDQLLIIPATFLLAFWFLQKEIWTRLTSRTYVALVMVAGLILMTNLLTLVQNMVGLRVALNVIRRAARQL